MIVVHDQNGLHVRHAGITTGLAGPQTTSFSIGPNGDLAYATADDQGQRLSVLARSGDAVDLYSTSSSIEGLTWGPGGGSLTWVEPATDVAVIQTLDVRSRGLVSFSVLEAPHLAAEPSWSADGQWLAVEAQPTEELRGMTVYLHDRFTGTTRIVDPEAFPEPKSACPRFGPLEAQLAYTYTDHGVLDSQVRVLDVKSGSKRIVEDVGLNDPRWSSDGRSLLAVRHDSICQTRLVSIDVDSLRVMQLHAGAGHITPIAMNSSTALFVARECENDEGLATEPGRLESLDLASNKRRTWAEFVYSAQPVAHVVGFRTQGEPRRGE